MAEKIDIHGRYFWYLGKGGEKYGPHTERQMLKWYRESFLSSDVRIAEGDLCDGPTTFKPLAVYLMERGVANPFMPFDCIPKEDTTKETVMMVRHMQENMQTEIMKMKKEMTGILAMGLANISLCLAKDGETMQAILMKQMEEARKKWKEEEGDRAKRDYHTSFERSLDFLAFTGNVPSSLPFEWMSGLKTKMDEITDVAVSFKIDSEFTLQKIEGLQHIIDGLLERLDASTARHRIDVTDYESALKNFYDILRDIAERANGVLEGRSNGLPNVVRDLAKVMKMMEAMCERIRRNSKESGQWKQILEYLTGLYAELTALQQRLLAAVCTFLFPEKPQHNHAPQNSNSTFQQRTERQGREFRQRTNPQVENQRRRMSAPPLQTYRRNKIRQNNNYRNNRHSSNNNNFMTSSFRQQPPPHLAQDRSRGGGFSDFI